MLFKIGMVSKMPENMESGSIYSNARFGYKLKFKN